MISLEQNTKKVGARRVLDAQQRPRIVKVWRDGQTLSVCPAVPELRRYLQTLRIEPREDASHGYRVERKAVPLFEITGVGTESTLECWAGLEPVVRTVLWKASHRIQSLLSHYGIRSLPSPCLFTGQGDIPVDSNLLGYIEQHDRGVVRYNAVYVNPLWLILQIIHAFPAASIVVVATGIDQVRGIRNQLLRHTPDGVRSLPCARIHGFWPIMSRKVLPVPCANS
jgi:hypothetical protein